MYRSSAKTRGCVSAKPNKGRDHFVPIVTYDVRIVFINHYFRSKLMPGSREQAGRSPGCGEKSPLLRKNPTTRDVPVRSADAVTKFNQGSP